MAATLPAFTAATFDAAVLKSDIPVLVDFGAAWCSACRALAPLLDDLAAEYAGRVQLGAVDTDAERALASEYKISALPTLIVFKGGLVHDRCVGVVGRAKLRSMLDSALS